MNDFSAALPRPVSPAVRGLGVALMVVGTGSFALSAKGDTASRAWGMLLVSTVFFLGIAMAGVVISAVLKVAVGNWGRSISRIAESLFSFAPVAIGLVAVILLFGAKHIYPWATEKVHQGAWLTVPTVFARDIVMLGILWLLGSRFVSLATTPDAIVLRKKLSPAQAGADAEVKAALQREATSHRWMAPVYILCWAVFMSFIAFDMIMSIDPHWTSALFGAWYFMGTLYTAWATTWALTAITNRDGRLSTWMTTSTYHDLGKFTFSWCMAWMYLFWCQYLPYWYGNMHEDTHYFLLRTRGVYEHLAFTTLVLCFVVPFFGMLTKKAKVTPFTMLFFTGVIWVGMLLQHYMEIIPSLSPSSIPFGLPEIGIPLGVAGLFVLTVSMFRAKHPMMPLANPPATSHHSHAAAAHAPAQAHA